MRATTLKSRVLQLSLAVGMAVLPLASSASAADCPAVKYRLWQKDGFSWYDHGETVEIEQGTEGHLYLHVRGKGPTPYSTSAEIGYPSAFKLGGDSYRVREHLRMNQQNAEDLRAGRIRFTAEKPGTVHLGYELKSAKPPGDLGVLRRGCRVDRVAIRVLGDGPVAGDRDDDRDDREAAPQAAAREIVEVLYRGLLRRERHGEDSRSFVDQVERNGRRGIEAVAESIMTSSEFRYKALERTEDQRAERSRDLAELRQWLLQDMYRDLYGHLEPSSREVEDDLEDLDACLSSERYSEEACSRLASNLVTHRLFEERYRDELRYMGRYDGRRGRRN